MGRERPIGMRPESVLGILDGRKTQTRRVVTPQPLPGLHYGRWVGDVFKWDRQLAHDMSLKSEVRAPCMPGDMLWVRETWKPDEREDLVDGIRFQADDAFVPIEATREAAERWVEVYDNGRFRGWRAGRYLRRCYARLFLDVVDVRPERLSALTEADARAEGCVPIEVHMTGAHPVSTSCAWAGGGAVSARELYAVEWDRINAKRGYPFSSNPWVWVIEFRRR